MNILVVGRGWVGRKMFDQLVINGHVVTLCPHHKAENLINVINHHDYDWVVNCAGVTGTPNVDACEDIKAETMEGNAIFPVNLQQLCESLHIKFAHFSSGCIYEGEITDEYADPNFFGSTYSVSKGVSDVLLKSRCLVFRVRLPFDGSHSPKNLLQKLYNYSKKSKLVEGGLNSITDIDEAIEHAADLIERDADGPYNLVNQGAITTHEIAELMELNADWWSADEFKTVAVARRSNCTIPEYENMSPVKLALLRRINQFKETL